jgi:hypothetical protein
MDDLELKNHLDLLYTGLKSTLEQVESISLQVEAILFSRAASDPEFAREYEMRHNTLTSSADDASPSPLLKRIDDSLQLLARHKSS